MLTIDERNDIIRKYVILQLELFMDSVPDGFSIKAAVLVFSGGLKATVDKGLCDDKRLPKQLKDKKMEEVIAIANTYKTTRNKGERLQ